MSWTLLATAAVAAIVSWMATRAATVLARRLSVLDRPGGYKRHADATPLLGGLGVAAGWCAALPLVLSEASRVDAVRLGAVSAGAALTLVAGLIDDIHGLAPQRKLAWQVGAAAAAGLCLGGLGVHLDLFLHWPPAPIILLTALWVVFIVNALNFIDNMNGLCAGIGAIGAGALAAVNARQGEPCVALAAVALAGACLGFLPHNWPRARIFLGDTGSMLIGFLLAALSVMGVYTRPARVPALAVFTPLCILAIPIFDALLVIGLRLWARRAPWIGDRWHLSHRLVRHGLQPTTAVALLWAVSAAGGLVGLMLPLENTSGALLLLGVLLSILAGLAGAAGMRGLE